MRLDHWALHPEVTFLNHGSFGATPIVVLEEQQRLRAELEREPIRFLAPERELESKLDVVRDRVAGLIGARSADVAFVRNATDGCNAVLRSFPFSEGDEVVVTDHGYRACSNAAAYAAERVGARVKVARIPFPLRSSGQALEAIVEACSERTKLILVDHITSPTALVLPIDRIVAHAHEHGIRVLVDAAHAPGMVPMDVAGSRADYTTGNLHKWMCCPKVSGFLHVREEHQHEVRPSVISHAATAARPKRSKFLAEFDWTGTFDPTSLLSFPMALDFLEGLREGGLEGHMKANHDLAMAGAELLRGVLGVEASAPESMLGSMVSLPLPDGPPPPEGGTDPLHQRLYEHHSIEVPIAHWPEVGKRWVRISAQAYNELADYERLAAALSEELARV